MSRTKCSIRSRRWRTTTWPTTRPSPRRCSARAPTVETDGRELHELGERAGSAATQELARLANEHPPVLRTHDSRGNRIDEVEFHPAWHELMAVAVGHGMHAAPWRDRTPGRARRTGGQVLRVDAGGGRAWLPDLHDLRLGAGAAARPRARRPVRAAARLLQLRSRAAGSGREGRPAGRHGHDREAGGFRRQGQHHQGGAGRRRLPAHRAQVVLFRAYVRPVPCPGPGP